MDFPTIWQQLQDLPKTFRRDGTPYSWLIDSLAGGLYLLCQASDALQKQLNFSTSQEGWLDVWGSLAGITRNINEPNITYQNRIQQTVLAWRDSPVAIERFTKLIENTTVVVTEQSTVGYTLLFPFLNDTNRINKIVLDLKYVRPAGVPFSAVSQAGTYLSTVNYYGTVGTVLQPPIQSQLLINITILGKLINIPFSDFSSDFSADFVPSRYQLISPGDFSSDFSADFAQSQYQISQTSRQNINTGNIKGSYLEEDTYLNTVNYYGQVGTYFALTGTTSGSFIIQESIQIPLPPIGRVTGAYLASHSPINLTIPASTNNVTGIIPDLLFTDKTLNPGLS